MRDEFAQRLLRLRIATNKRIASRARATALTLGYKAASAEQQIRDDERELAAIRQTGKPQSYQPQRDTVTLPEKRR